LILTLDDLRLALSKFPKKPHCETLQKLYPDIYESIIKHTQGYPSNIRFSWRIQLILDGMVEIPSCPQCGKPCKWVDRHWSSYCSRLCSTRAKYGVDNYSQVDSVKLKRLNTVRNRYKVDNVSQLSNTQDKIKQSSLDHFGVAHHLMAPSVIAKRAKTNVDTYGVENVFQDPSVKDRAKNTNNLRYGVDYPQQSEAIRSKTRESLLNRFGVTTPLLSPIVKELYHRTLMKNYGVLHPQQSKTIRSKTQDTCLSKYGCKSPLQSYAVREKIRLKMVHSYGVSNPFESHILMGRDWSPELIAKLTSRSFWEDEYTTNHRTLLDIGAELGVSGTTACNYMHRYAPDVAVRSQGSDSNEEHEVRDFIKSIIPSDAVVSTRFKDLNPESTNTQGLDIYIPSRKLAFEYNGLYWHSNLNGRGSDYHLGKTLEAENLGIRLVHIWSDDWINNNNIIRSKIKSILGVRPDRTVFARKCSIEVPTPEERHIFYEANHIKGDRSGSVSYMLKYKDIILAMITFRSTKDPYVFDLVRFAVDASVSVPGGFSKLLAHFMRNNHWTEIFTFADRAWSLGNVYQVTGFTLTGTTRPAFHGIELGKRVSRLRYTHARLATKFPSTYDPDKTQVENLSMAKIPLIYDCGNYVFKLWNRKI